MLVDVVVEIVDGVEGVCVIAVSYCVGMFDIGDAVLVVVVVVDHCRVAFETCVLVVDMVKD
ncbi:MAG: molybdenum cofactor biosynthesis protein MoaE [Rickettsia endosymbiont of Ixodes persulcatus]|nr:molybdenum cofactor biosynthesis protein MoaE [Rickettsia endosymbiont of Ixodes persulcatus]